MEEKSPQFETALDILEAVFKLAPELVDLLDRWLSGDPTTPEADPIYAQVKARMDAAMLRLSDEMDALDKVKKDLS